MEGSIALLNAVIAAFGLPLAAGLILGVASLFFWNKYKKPSPQADMSQQLLQFQDMVMIRLTHLENENTRLRSEIEKLHLKQTEKDLEIQKLRYDLALIESAHLDLPVPMWLKDENGVMLSVNRAYEELFLIPMGKSRNDYIGNTDFEVWPTHIANQFTANDGEVWRTGKMFNAVEKFLINGEEVEQHVLKYVYHTGGVRLGVGGIAIPQRTDLLRLA